MVDNKIDKVVIRKYTEIKYRMLADIYASSNIHYTAVETFNSAVVVQQLLYAHVCSQLALPRRRDLDCLENDNLLASITSAIKFELLKVAEYGWSAYLAAYVGIDFDNSIDLQSEIKRNNEPMLPQYL